MKIKLFHRHYGVHTFIREAEVNVLLKSIYHGEDDINEPRLLGILPPSLLPKGLTASVVLVTVADSRGIGTGQRGLKLFRNWAKYFDAYVIELSE